MRFTGLWTQLMCLPSCNGTTGAAAIAACPGVVNHTVFGTRAHPTLLHPRRNAYIMAAVHGTGYCTSAVLAVKTLATNFVRAAAVAYVGWALVRAAHARVLVAVTMLC